MSVNKESQHPEMKYQNFQPRTTSQRLRLRLFSLILFTFAAAGYALQSRPTKHIAEPNEIFRQADVNSTKLMGEICSAIYKGDFALAKEQLTQQKLPANQYISQLADIVGRYDEISGKLQTARREKYNEKLENFKKIILGADSNDVNDINDVIDVNDVNDIKTIDSAFSAIVQIFEFANKEQKAEILSEPFTKDIIGKSLAEAAKFEAGGDWLGAYAHCYGWLKVIEPNNKFYNTKADELYEKVNILATFKDSPCETRKERYSGIKKEMFIKAIDALHYNYVSYLDYQKMTVEAVKRCKSLAEVMSLSYDEISTSETMSSLKEDSSVEFKAADSNSLAVWSQSLNAILEQLEKPAVNVSKDSFVRIFSDILVLNQASVKLPGSILITHYSQAALSALDNYTVMIWPTQQQDFDKMMTNEFTGVGIEINKEDGDLTVASLLPDTPAYYSGIDAGDIIQAVDDIPTKDMSLNCAVKHITGPNGTNVRLTMKSPGREQTWDVNIIRAKITVPTIRGWQRAENGEWLYMIDSQLKIGYVRITSFSGETSPDLEETLIKLEKDGLKGLILDLRFNSGGLLDSAIAVTDKFIKEGLIVRTRGRWPQFGTSAYAHDEGTLPGYPLVILVNSGSASASEIVAGALQDPKYKRAILVGERTVGKGSVQGITSYPGDGAQLKYTMAYYYLPSGQRVEARKDSENADEKWGIGPDIELELKIDELRNMFKVQKENDVLVKLGHDNGVRPLKRYSVEESLEADPQLEVGLLVVKSKLIEQQGLTSDKL